MAALQIPDARAIAAKVDAHYNALRSLRAHFNEHYQGPGLDRLEAGVLLLVKPGKMRWDYDQPAGKVFLVDGKDAYFYVPGNPDAQRISVSKLDDLRSPLRFLLGKTKLEKEMQGLASAEVNGSYRLTGRLGSDSAASQLTIDVDTAGEIQRLSSIQPDGTTISFVFSEIEDNVPVAAGAFHFVAPAGVTIVNGEPAQ